VLVAAVVVEIIFLRDDISRDVLAVLEAGRSEATATGTPPSSPPIVAAAPTAAGAISRIDIRQIQPCASGADCARCHGVAYAGGQPLPPKHANGVVDVGDGQGQGCSSCHGDASSPAPPRDAAGRTSEALASVGAHRAHLEARHHLRGPIACTECHQVPATPKAAGHIDSALPAEVFPTIPGVGALARADGAAPVYDAATASCGSVYCHGAGTAAARDQAPSRILNPSWTGGTSQAVCGSCHGIPPKDGLHPLTLTLGDCVQCHAPSVAAGGSIRITTDPITGAIGSTHIDGEATLGTP